MEELANYVVCTGAYWKYNLSLYTGWTWRHRAAAPERNTKDVKQNLQSCICRITGWLRLEGTSGVIWPNPLLKQGCLEQVAQDHV